MLKLESSIQAADGEDLVILACTVFDWSTRVTDGRTDRQTDRIAMVKTRCSNLSNSCFARKNWSRIAFSSCHL